MAADAPPGKLSPWMPAINTKDVGVCTFAYPKLKALALPTCKDKQRSQPTPGCIYTTHNAASAAAHNVRSKRAMQRI